MATPSRPRGGEIALAALLELMAALGVTEGVVRTAVSRLARDGWLEGHRAGRRSFYRLSRRGLQETADAGPRIYGPLDPAWGGKLRLAFAEAGVERTFLERAGYALLAPGLLVAPDTALTPPPGLPSLLGAGEPAAMRSLAARAWPVARVGAGYERFVRLFAEMDGQAPGLAPLEAMAARVLLMHEYPEGRVARPAPAVRPVATGLARGRCPRPVCRAVC